MRRIFYNRFEQLRSGWKIAMLLGSFLAAALIIGIVIGIALAVVMIGMGNRMNADMLSVLTNAMQTDYSLLSVISIVQDVGIIVAVIVLWKSFDKKPIRNLGLTSVRKGYKDLLKGLFLGIIAISTVFSALLVTGSITVVQNLNNPKLASDLILGIIMFIFVGFGEEILSRGYCMTVLKQTGSKWVVVLIPSIIFSLMHSLNPNVSSLGLFNTFLVGALFSYMVVKTGSIWMPIGFHITWNYLQGNIFGFSVSGMETQSGILISRNVAENIVNGGMYGPEGGIVTTLVVLMFFVILWKIIDDRKTYWTTPVGGDIPQQG